MTSITSIQRGIVFLLARWSGPAVNARDILLNLLQDRGISEHLLCVDVDREPEIYDVPELSGKIHGWGEAAVVRDGKIVFVTVLGKDLGRIQEHCDELFRAYSA
jgi:hypothetical protein